MPAQQRADVVEREPGRDLLRQPIRHELDGLLEVEVRLLRLRAERQRLSPDRHERDDDDEHAREHDQNDGHVTNVGAIRGGATIDPEFEGERAAQMPMRWASSSRW